jgi:hypothetical protein
MIEADFWMHQYANKAPTSEEFEDSDFDLAAEAARIDAEAEMQLSQAGGGGGPVGVPLPPVGTEPMEDDWEPLE